MGGGNKGYFKDTTARNKIGDLSQTGVSGEDAAEQIETLKNFKCEGGMATFKNVSIADQMDALKAAGRNGLFTFYISSANPDFSTVGYCIAIGSILSGGVSTITAVNSQTGVIWTNGNVSQNAGAWTGWKKISPDNAVDSISGSGSYSSTYKAYKNGSVVNLSIRNVANSSLNQQMQLFYLPEGWRPKMEIDTVGKYSYGNFDVINGNGVTFRVETNGKCWTYSYHTFTSGNADFTYIV